MYVDSTELQGLDPRCAKADMKLASNWLESSSESDEETTTPTEDTDSKLFFNKFIQLREGEASGLLWTARLNTKGDATGTGFFMGKEVGHG